MTAWDVGRLLNHLHFVLQQAWLLPSRDQADSADSLWTDLAMLVRGLFSSPGDTDERSQQILDERRRWADAFGNLRHHELLESEYAELERRRYADSERSTRSLRDEVCRRLLHPVRETVETLHEIIERGVDERLVRLFRLAEAVDRGVHPTDEYGHFFESANAVPRGEDNEDSEAGRSTDAWSGRMHAAAIPIERPTVVCAVAERDDPVTWIREIDQRWCELGFPHESLPDSVSRDRLPAPNEATLRTECGPIVDAVDDSARAVAVELLETSATQQSAADSGSKGRADEPTPGFLGLMLNHDNREVRRNGWDASITIEGPVRWGVFAYLVRRRENFTSRAEFNRRWEKFGGDTAVLYTRVYDVLGYLRRRLSRIGLTIENQRASGWRIAEETSRTQTPPTGSS